MVEAGRKVRGEASSSRVPSLHLGVRAAEARAKTLAEGGVKPSWPQLGRVARLNTASHNRLPSDNGSFTLFACIWPVALSTTAAVAAVGQPSAPFLFLLASPTRPECIGTSPYSVVVRYGYGRRWEPRQRRLASFCKHDGVPLLTLSLTDSSPHDTLHEKTCEFKFAAAQSEASPRVQVAAVATDAQDPRIPSLMSGNPFAFIELQHRRNTSLSLPGGSSRKSGRIDSGGDRSGVSKRAGGILGAISFNVDFAQ
eukprot:3663895-Pleurochrysis_carterae.AAC.2